MTFRLPIAAAALLALAACNSSPDSDAPTTEPTAVGAVETAAPVAAEASGAPVLVPEAEKGETGARNVLLEWARDLEHGDYDGAYALWLDGARSGMTKVEHTAYWQRFKTITVAMPTGTMEGAAGSLYYEAATTVVGKQQNGTPYRLEGTVTLRRVNDVDGATPEQLRWHLEKVDLHEVS